MRKNLKFLLLFLSLFCFYSCELDVNEEIQSESKLEVDELMIESASVREVLSFVKIAYPQKYEALRCKEELLEFDFVTNITYERGNSFESSLDTRSSVGIDTLLCIVNFGEDEGFAVVETKDNQVLVVTETGSLSIDELTVDYTTEDFENNPKAVISTYISNYIVTPTTPTDPTVPDNPIDFGYEVIGDWETESQIAPLVQMKLHQGNPYNMYCVDSNGNSVSAGCGAIAIIQMMSGNKYPTTIGGVTRNWNTLINQYQTSALTKRMLAQWIKTIGDECGINYYNGESGCSLDGMMNCISSYSRYTNVGNVNNPNYGNVFLMLENEKPLPFVGFRVKENGGISGHAWVVDGCITQKRSVKLCTNSGAIIDEYYETRDLIHCNWGWNGVCDGYYFMNIFDLSEGAVVPDEDFPSTQNRHYNLNLSAIIYNFE